MSAYTNPILRYGLARPAFFNCVLLAVVLSLNGKLQKTRHEKEARYEEQVARLASIANIEAAIAPKRQVFEDQKRLLQSDPSAMFTRLTDSMLAKYRHIELERTGVVFPSDRGRVGRLVGIETGRVKGSFEGGFGPMQETMLQVEALMPQALLEDLKITRKVDVLPNKPRHLVFEMTYLCWKAPETRP